MPKTEIEQLLEKLQEQSEGVVGGELTRRELTTLRKVLRAYENLESWGRLGRILIWLAMSAAALAVSWGEIKGFFSKW